MRQESATYIAEGMNTLMLKKTPEAKTILQRPSIPAFCTPHPLKLFRPSNQELAIAVEARALSVDKLLREHLLGMAEHVL